MVHWVVIKFMWLITYRSDLCERYVHRLSLCGKELLRVMYS